MTVSLTLVSGNDQVLSLVRDFVHGLGRRVDDQATAVGRSLRIEIDDDQHSLVELLTHIALSTAKAGVDFAEPLCHVTCRHPGATSDVTLTLRIADFRIDTTART
jgi:hypothetical protein